MKRIIIAAIVALCSNLANAEPNNSLCQRYKEKQLEILTNRCSATSRIIKIVKRAYINSSIPSTEQWHLRDGSIKNYFDWKEANDIQKVVFKNYDTKRNTIDNLTKQSKQARMELTAFKNTGVCSIKILLTIPLNVGQIGYLDPNQSLKVARIIDDSNMICEISYFVKYEETYKENKVGYGIELTPGMSTKSMDMAGKSEPMVKEIKMIWLRGIPTSGFADDDKVVVSMPLDIVGTKDYTTPTGQKRTFFLFEPCQ